MKNLLSLFDYKGNVLKVVDKYKIWFGIPVAILSVAIIVFIVFAIIGGSFVSGFNVGIDFTGGTILTVQIGELAEGDTYQENADALRDIVESKGMNVGYVQVSGTGNQAAIIVRYQGNFSEEQMANLNDEIKEEIQVLYPEIFAEDPIFISAEYIGATTSTDLLFKAFLSILIAGVAILLYIIIRFEIFSGITAIIALIHDVLLIFAFVTIARVQLNSTFIAVLITIISYSINNTIVVFDRVRENLLITPVNNNMTYGMVVNKSISETLGRSINTTITTLFTITVLAIIGVPVIRDFALMIIVGLISGTFSSLCIAPTIYAIIREKLYKKEHGNKYVSKPKKA